MSGDEKEFSLVAIHHMKLYQIMELYEVTDVPLTQIQSDIWVARQSEKPPSMGIMMGEHIVGLIRCQYEGEPRSPKHREIEMTMETRAEYWTPVLLTIARDSSLWSWDLRLKSPRVEAVSLPWVYQEPYLMLTRNF
jgi:hypothetical protein